jgi:hypothetical protein
MGAGGMRTGLLRFIQIGATIKYRCSKCYASSRFAIENALPKMAKLKLADYVAGSGSTVNVGMIASKI